MKNTNILIASLLLILTACSDEPGQIGNGSSGRSAMSVDYVVVSPRPLSNTINVTGTLMPAESAMLSAQTSGQVKQIFFEEGQRVNKGELLVKLDDRQWLAQRGKLEAQLKTARKDVDRKEQLADIKGVSQAAIDDANLAVESIEADKQELDVMIEYASIRAPFTGEIGLRSVSPGSYLSAGVPVARIVKVDPLKLEFNVPERYATQIKSGQAVRFTIGGSDSTYQATVYAMEPAITESSRALRIRARVPNENGHLVAGAFADIKLSLDSIPNAILVPTEAVVPQLNEQIVYTIENGKIKQTKIKQGIRLPRLIQVESGLTTGDTVMVSGLLQAREGSSVKAGNKISIEKLKK